MHHFQKLTTIAAATAIASAALATPAMAGELSANASVTNNYIWRGLTRTENESALADTELTPQCGIAH